MYRMLLLSLKKFQMVKITSRQTPISQQHSQPLLKAGFRKLSHLWGTVVPNFLTKKGDNHEKGGDVKIGGCHFFNYFTFQSHLWCV